MTIGFDGSRAFQGNRTGTENYSYQLLKVLAQIDKRNTYIVYLRPGSVIPAYAGIQLSISSSELDSRLRGNDYYSWPKNFQFKKIPWPRLWTQGGLAVQTFKDRLDVLFVPAHTLPIIRRPGLKTVVTVHDLGSEYLPSMHQIRQRFYLGFMQKVQLKTATKIIAVSKATKEDLVKRVGLSPDKVSVIYEGYDKDLFKPIKGDALINTLRYYNLQPKTYLLFVGTVQPRKNLERLIRAFAKFHLRGGLKLVIAGSKGWLSDEIYNAAAIVNQRYKKRSDVIASDYELPKKLGIEGRVKFLGYVPEKDLPALYSGAVALTFPSLFEGFGLPILEAQASGCPVLTSNISSMPEVAGKGAVYVDPYSVDDIVEGMEKVQNSKVKSQNIKAGFENIKRFSWEKCARETLEVLERL